MKQIEENSIEINDFLDYKSTEVDKVIDEILNNITKSKEIGYAGCEKKEWIKMSLERFIPNYHGKSKIIYPTEENKNKAQNICIKTLKEQTNMFNKIHVFIFPTFDSFVKEKMEGVSGFCSGDNVILIFINFEGEWKKGIEGTVLHELAHAISPHYKGGEFSIGEGMIFDGLAEHFREEIMKDGKSNLSTAISEEESNKIFNELKYKLDSEKLKDYTDVFYGTGKYPNWAGYTIGYNLITKYLEGKNNINWNELLKKNPKEIMNELLKKL